MWEASDPASGLCGLDVKSCPRPAGLGVADEREILAAQATLRIRRGGGTKASSPAMRHTTLCLRARLLFRHVAHDRQLEHLVLVGLENQQKPEH